MTLTQNIHSVISWCMMEIRYLPFLHFSAMLVLLTGLLSQCLSFLVVNSTIHTINTLRVTDFSS